MLNPYLKYKEDVTNINASITIGDIKNTEGITTRRREY